MSFFVNTKAFYLKCPVLMTIKLQKSLLFPGYKKNRVEKTESEYSDADNWLALTKTTYKLYFEKNGFSVYKSELDKIIVFKAVYRRRDISTTF